MDDDFWWKLNEDDDYMAMFGNNKSGNVSHKSRSSASCKKPVMPTQNPESKVIPTFCNVQNDYSLFNKTKVGSLLYSLILILPVCIQIFLSLTIVFLILEKVITILFAMLFASSILSLFIVAKVRSNLNNEYKQSIANKQAITDKESVNNNAPTKNKTSLKNETLTKNNVTSKNQ